MMALLMVHDTLTYPAFHNGTARMKYDKVWEDLRAAEPDVEFLPYWNNANVVTASPESVKVSIWRRPQAALLAIANLSGDDLTASLQVDWRALGLPTGALSITDGITGEVISADGISSNVSIPAKRVRMLIATPL